MRTRFSAAVGLVLAMRLLKVAPARLPARIVDALTTLRASAVALQQVAVDRLRLSPQNLRPLDLALDNAWMALSEAIAAVARLDTPLGQEARALLGKVFPRGTSFVKATYEEYTTSSQILQLIEQQRLEPAIRRVAGDAFLPFIRASHEAFGEGLGLGASTPEVTDSTGIARAVVDLADAIADYGRLMVGWLDWNDPAKVTAFQKAMAPLDAHRKSIGGTRPTDEPSAEPGEEPVEPSAEPTEDVSPTDPVPPLATDAEA